MRSSKEHPLSERAIPKSQEPEARSCPTIMTIEQVAAYLQLHPQVVYRHVRAGTLPASRIGRTIRFKKSVLDEFLEKGAWEFAHQYLTYLARVKSGSVSVAGEMPKPATLTARATSAAVPMASQTPPEIPDALKQFSADID